MLYSLRTSLEVQHVSSGVESHLSSCIKSLCVYALWPSGFGFADTVIIIIIVYGDDHLCLAIYVSLTQQGWKLWPRH